MRVKYNPKKNLESRMLRQLFKDRKEVIAGEICSQLSLELSDLSEILCRLSEFLLIDSLGWPINENSRIILMEHDLVLGKEYDVLLVAYGSYRILSEGSNEGSEPEPYQFHRELFVVTNQRIPNSWVAEWVEGELSIHPPGWDNSFFCDFFEEKPNAKKKFFEELALYFPETYKRWLNHKSNRKYSEEDS
jgi:hypothetical protein